MGKTHRAFRDRDGPVDRRKLLSGLEFLEFPPYDAFDRLTELTRRLLDVPLARISFVADGREWVVDSAGRVVLRVRDNGPGLPEDFDPGITESVGFEILQAPSEHELGGTLAFPEDSMTTVEVRFEREGHKSPGG